METPRPEFEVGKQSSRAERRIFIFLAHGVNANAAILDEIRLDRTPVRRRSDITNPRPVHRIARDEVIGRRAEALIIFCRQLPSAQITILQNRMIILISAALALVKFDVPHSFSRVALSIRRISAPIRRRMRRCPYSMCPTGASASRPNCRSISTTVRPRSTTSSRRSRRIARYAASSRPMAARLSGAGRACAT